MAALMPWARLDDRYHEHKKTRRVLRREPAAGLLHVMAITFCNAHNTDGEIETERVDEWLALMPHKATQRQRVFKALFELDLFKLKDGDPDTLLVVDYLQWNRSRDERASLAEQGRRGGQAKAKANGKPPDGPGSGPGLANAKPTLENGFSGTGKPPASEGSSTPIHATPRHAKEEQHVAASPPLSDQDRELEERVAYLSHLLSAEVRMAHGIAERSREALPVKGWHDACRSMLKLDGFSADQVEFAIRWVCKHHYWRHRVKSMPRLRSEMEQVVAEIRKQREGGQVVPFGRKPSAGDLIRKLNESEAS